jgi:PAS domain S-box-containing protein
MRVRKPDHPGSAETDPRNGGSQDFLNRKENVQWPLFGKSSAKPNIRSNLIRHSVKGFLVANHRFKPSLPLFCSFLRILMVTLLIPIPVQLITVMKNTHFENFFELSTELLCLIDANGFFVLVNPAFRSVLGYSLEELARRSYTSFIHPDDLADTLALATKLLKGEPVHQYENRYLTKDGRVVWLSWMSTTRYEDYYYAAAKDITSQKEAEQSLLTSQKKFRSLVQNGYEIITVIGADGTYRYHSNSVYRLLGYDPQEMIGRSARDIVHPEDLPKVERTMAQIQSVPHVNNGIPYRLRAADGSYRWFESTASNMMDDPDIRGIVVNSREVTERVSLEQELQRQTLQKEKELGRSMIQGQEQERMRLGQELHDNINQLLTSAKLYLEFMETSDANHQAMLSKTKAIIEQAITEIRTLSHQLVLPGCGTFELRQHIEETAHDLLTSRRIQVKLDMGNLKQEYLEEELPVVLYRIVQEQLTNIVKHAEATRVRITVAQDAGGLRLSICDNGKGFDPSRQGKGIGLSNMVNRVRVFGGQVNLDARPGEGCRLTVCFPCIQSSSPVP